MKLALFGILMAVAPTASADVDKAALRALITLPSIDISVKVETAALRRELSFRKIPQANQEALLKKEDPDVQYRMADLLVKAEEGKKAREYAEKAVALYDPLYKAKKLAPQSEVNYIRSLLILGSFDPAQRMVADRFKAEGEDWLTWTLRAEYYGEKADRLITGEEDRPDFTASLTRLASDRTLQTEAEAAIAEAEKSAAKSIALAPANGDAYRASVEVAVRRTGFDVMMEIINSRDPSKKMFTAATANTIWEASKANPNDPYLATDCFMSTLYAEMRDKDLGSDVAPISVASPEGKARLDAAIERLKGVANAAEGPDTVAAVEALGVASYFYKQYAEMTKWLKKAHEMQPGNTRIAENYMHALIFEKSYVAAAEIGEQLLKDQLSVPRIAATAKAHDYAGNKVRATQLIVDGLIKYGSSPLLRLARASMLLREPSSDKLIESGDILNSLSGLTEDDIDYLDDLRFTRAVYFGLLGDTAEARRLLEDLQKGDKSEEKYGKALKALG